MRDIPLCQSILQTSLFCTNLGTLVLSLLLLLIIGGILTDAGLSVLSSLPPEVSANIESLLFDHKGDVFLIPVTLLFAFLSLTFLVSFLGCFSACLGSRCLMAVYFSLLLLLFFTCLGLTVSTLALDLQTLGEDILNGTIPLYTESPDVQAAWDTVQSRLNCCGVVSYKDWNILNLQTNFCFIPESCDRKFRRNFDSLCLGSPHYFLFKDILNQLQNTRNSQTSIQK